MKTFLQTILFIFASLSYAQVGINTDSPAATLDVMNKGNLPAGIIAPRITANELSALDDAYGPAQNGAIVYVTQLSGGQSTNKTKNIIIPGYYHYSAADEQWLGIATGTEPWHNTSNFAAATSNTQDIYQMGSVAVGSFSVDENAQFEVSSNKKGVLLPRLTSSQRDAIPTNLANGLLIYNTTTDCFNYYSAASTKWLSLCGTGEPASFNLLNCTDPTGPEGTFTKGNALNSTNIYKVVVNVTSIGTYQMTLRTVNGYSFSKSGSFTQTGSQTVALEGQGTPNGGPQTDAVSSLEFNGIIVSPNCTLPGIQVEGNTTNVVVNCNAASVHGTYQTSVAPDSSNYIDIPVTAVNTPGTALVETNTINGLKFSSGSVTISASTTFIRLYAQGMPQSAGTNTYSFTVPGSSACSLSVTVSSSIGTFSNPANKCLEILQSGSSGDGYYWIKDNSNNKFKTYCDMSNGGWTLVNSRSERQMIVLDKSQAMSISSMTAKNAITTVDGVFNEYNFSVPSSVMSNISSTSGSKEIRIIIKEKGSTGTSASAVEGSTVAPINDTWARENYWQVKIVGGTDPYVSNYTSNQNTTVGKIFNIPLSKTVSGTDNYTFNGTPFAANPPGFYSVANFFTGFYGARGYVSNSNVSNNITYTYTSDASKTFTFNKYYINDLFGLYLNSENQLNHHIGTCANSTDDFGGGSECNNGWNNWRAHNLNLKDGNYEGRILQYYVK